MEEQYRIKEVVKILTDNSESIRNIEISLAQINKFQKPHLNTNDAAEYIGLSVSTLYKLTSKGEIPFTKLSHKKNLFYKARLDEWIEAKHKEPSDNITHES